jgi:hypothetical protein
MLTFVVFLIVLALLFDFLNGMNDAANSIATIVSTRVLSPWAAVIWAAFFNLVAAFFFGVHVATTIGKGVVNPQVIDASLILSTLLSAIVWTFLCTRLGLPISVSHALVGGLVGSGVAKGGFGALYLSGLLKIGSFIVLAPVIGLLLGFGAMVAVLWIFRRSAPRRVNRWFRRLQLVSAAAYSLGHGTNDAQKTMGIIAVLLFTSGYMDGGFHVPFWVLLGHPDWRQAEISVFAALPSDQVSKQRGDLEQLMFEGRIPISKKNVGFISVNDVKSFRAIVAERSADADLFIVGFDLKGLREREVQLFRSHPSLKAVLFVQAAEAIAIE